MAASIAKPFTYDQISLWRGQDLVGKSLLLLEEQAVGDIMQFLTLLPALSVNAKISILLNDRLVPIYQRTFKESGLCDNINVVSFSDIRSNNISPSSFDYQSPLGSICQYRFTHPSHYGKTNPFLVSNKSMTKDL